MTSTPYHWGRSWSGTELEDACQCGQAPCGLVSSDLADPDCAQHGMQFARSARQGHDADRCPNKPVAVVPPDKELRPITSRDREVLIMTAQGMTNEQIARSLIVHQSTVAYCIRRVGEHVGSSSRICIVVEAIRRGIIRMQDIPRR